MPTHEPTQPTPAGTATADAPALEARNIERRFGAVVALSDASIAIDHSEVLGLVGDNGAGKSTLLKILSGAVVPDSGRILLDGEEADIRRPQDALDAGIETVYQDLALVDTMSAMQNIYLGREQLASSRILSLFNVVNDRAMRKRASEIIEQLDVKIPSVTANVKTMSGGQRQSLAIARAILWGRNIVILDEPTAALGVRESRQVLNLIKGLRDHNVTVIVVSHNMQEIMEVADRVTVMRLGRSIATRWVRDTTVEEVIGLITGAVPGDRHDQQQGESG